MNPDLPPLLYRCPICSREVAVAAALMGETVRCPAKECGQPMLVEPPRAQFVGAAPAGAEAPAMATRSPADAERQLLTLRPSMWRNSPLKFAGAWLGLIASIGLFLWSISAARPGVGIFAAAMALLLVVGLGTWWIGVLATSLIVTTRRTTLRRGIFEKNTNEVQHDDVRNIQVEQGVVDRLLGVGTLKVSSSGQDDLEIIVDGIIHPGRVAETIRANQ